MSGNAQKTALARSLNVFAEGKVRDAFQRSGQALPCTVTGIQGSIVTVSFDVNTKFTLPSVTIPMWAAEYIRYPIQKGDKGCVFPADARLSGVSGIGGGTADLSQPGNLTALVFVPLANVSFSSVDPNAVVIYGPNGVVLRDKEDTSNITITPYGIVMTTDDVTINAEMQINGNVQTSENVVVGSGASGSITTATGQVVTIQDGIVTNIF